MSSPHSTTPQHPVFTRRTMLQAGSIGLLGLASSDVSALLAAAPRRPGRRAAVIYIFLSGGLAQHESFDLKPDAPDNIRGEFRPIATRSPGVQICEHLPLLAERSQRWALCRSLTHPHNEHSQGHHIMLTGRTDVPQGFSPVAPRPTDHPSIASIASYTTQPRNNLPPAVVLPNVLVHRTGRVIPGQFGGVMGQRWDPFFIRAAHNCSADAYGACPNCFRHDRQAWTHPASNVFAAPNLSLPDGMSAQRLTDRLGLLSSIDAQRRHLEQLAERGLDHHRQQAVGLLANLHVRQAFDVTRDDPRTLERYGRNQFGYSLLMARKLVEAGVNLVQVNLGNNETWDTHQAAFPNLREHLLPPMDRCVSALLDDLHDRGLLDNTLIVMAGEFGRTPRIFSIPSARLPGRDHWGAVQTVFFAGGGVRGGTVIGSSDRIGGYPATSPQTPENMAATIYHVLGLPRTAAWHDAVNRPHFIYHGDPIPGLM